MRRVFFRRLLIVAICFAGFIVFGIAIVKKYDMKHQTFSIYLFETDGHPFDISNWKLIKSIQSDSSNFKRNPVEIIADPFLFVHQGSLYLFYEEAISGKHGTIKMIKTNDLINWNDPVEVLKHSTHLSFPFVFEEAGNIYMIPETNQENNIQLLGNANQDLSEWTIKKVILEGDKYVDSSILLHDSVYYLFTTVLRDNYEHELQLYYSEDLYGKFKEHPKSPIAKGRLMGRCGGSIFEIDHKIFRPAQIYEKYYGESLSIYEIKLLTTNDYQEEIEIDRLLSQRFKYGGHHFNFVYFNDRIIIATDAVFFRYFLGEFYDRMIKKIKKI